jgi:hypothetical protein
MNESGYRPAAGHHLLAERWRTLHHPADHSYQRAEYGHPECGHVPHADLRPDADGYALAQTQGQRPSFSAEYKKTGRKMPVAVALGGDPVYAYSATAPLPENVDEYMLAGFLRKKKVELVKCITQPEIEVPADADFIIEGYVDPAEELIWEGPFGDHTGYYSLPDWYPRFHITAITHRKERCLSCHNRRHPAAGRCLAGKSHGKDLPGAH